MANKNLVAEKTNGAVVTFTVAECSEFHSLGEYHEGCLLYTSDAADE